LKKAIGWVLVIAGIAAFLLARALLTGPAMQAVAFAVLLAPLVGLYLLVDAYLTIEDGNVVTAFRPPRLWR
jgi:hypothetical protein